MDPIELVDDVQNGSFFGSYQRSQKTGFPLLVAVEIEPSIDRELVVS